MASTYSGDDGAMNISLAQEKGITEGNYQLYANTDGFLEIDAAGAKWNAIHLDQQTQGKLNAYWGDNSFGYVADVTDTRTIAEYAKKNGYRGVKISNVFDAQVFQHKQKKPSTVYCFFHPQEQVKSADPVTYDDYGNVIPLSERFDPKNNDLRYSLNAESQKAGAEKNTAKDGGADRIQFSLLDAEYGTNHNSNFNSSISLAEIEKNIDQVAKMAQVATITGKEFEKGEKDLVTQVEEFFHENGNKVYHGQLGEVVMDRRGIKSDIAHGIGRKKAAAFAAVPAVVEKGLIVDYQKNWKNRGYDTFVVAAPIAIGAEEHIAAAVLIRSNETNRFYVHEVLTTKDGAMPFKTGTSKKGESGGDTPSVMSILHKIVEVKKKLSLSAQGDVAPVRGGFYGEDIRLEAPVAADLRQNVQAEATPGAGIEAPTAEDLKPKQKPAQATAKPATAPIEAPVAGDTQQQSGDTDLPWTAESAAQLPKNFEATAPKEGMQPVVAPVVEVSKIPTIAQQLLGFFEENI